MIPYVLQIYIFYRRDDYMYCKNCGAEINDKADVCIHCGVSTNNTEKIQDNGGFGWGLLGYCIPIVGLVLFLVWKDSKPKSAKAAGIGALITTASIITFYVVIICVGLALY